MKTNNHKWNLVLLLAAFLMGCDHPDPEKTPQEPFKTQRIEAAYLEHSVAQSRAARVSDVNYTMSLHLPKENTPFRGKTDISFTLSDASQPLTLDFVGGEVESVSVNGRQIEVYYNGFFITLPMQALSVGPLTVTVEYTHPYVRDGKGLHWFSDPVDGETYLYTQFEPWSFNKVFPGFDQPDLKATYQLDVDAPSHWTVITARRETKVEAISESLARWTFPRSNRFSTYLMSLHAGPYHIWEDREGFRIPLRLFARQSYKEYVDVDDWLTVTKQGFDFFEDYFEYPFPFTKYDQVLVAEFNAGAMENVGAVTFAERLQPKREKTTKDRRRMAVVVLHEMAHQWFGNLVTMTWWDDIWLNESFADLMGNYAATKATDHKDAMESFSVGRKNWAYDTDLWRTTHPVAQDIVSTEGMSAKFDGITYAKGASSLIQLKHLLGEEGFRRGVTEYFKRYAWTNTRLPDFIGTLAKSAERDLSLWTTQWLQTAGVNTFEVSFQCDKGVVKQMVFHQSGANVSEVLREHSLDLLLLTADGDEHLINTSVAGKTTSVITSAGLPCPAFVLPNASDFSYGLIRLDKSSFGYITENLASISNPVHRALIWRSFREALRNGELAATGYLQLGMRYLPLEQDDAQVSTQLGNMRQALSYLEQYDEVKAPAMSLAAPLRRQFEEIAYRQYQQTEGALKLDWLRFWITYLNSDASIAAAKSLLADRALPTEFLWSLAGALIREGDPAGKSWVETLAAENVSSDDKLSAMVALAQSPDPQVKITWIEEAARAEQQYSYTQLRAVYDNLFPVGQYGLHRSLLDTAITPISGMVDTTSNTLLRKYVESTIPRQCSRDGIQSMQAMVGLDGLPESVQLIFRRRAEDEEICLRVFEAIGREFDVSKSASRAN